jgi:hypothetical protein
MKTALIAILLSLAIPTLAQVAPSTEGLDHGIVAGALFSKKLEVKAGKYKYNIISADLEEPACNSVQVVVFIVDDQLEGQSAVTYNLGVQVSGVVSAKAVGKKVVLKLRRNEVEDCSKSVVDSYTVEYTGSGSELKLKKLN